MGRLALYAWLRFFFLIPHQTIDFPLAYRPEKAADIEEIPSDRRVTTQIWVMPLICWGKFPSRNNQWEALPISG